MAKTGLNREKIVTSSAQGRVDIRQLSTILFQRRFLILSVSCVVMSVTSLLAVVTKPTYQSYMQILVSSNFAQGVRLSNRPQKQANGDLNDTNSLVLDNNAQIKLMLSSQLIQKAVELLRSNYPNITVEDIKGKKQTGKNTSLEVIQVAEKSGSDQVFSQVFEVSFKDHDPVKTKRVLQALQKVYQDYNIEQRQRRLNQGLAFVNNRLPKIQKEVRQSEKNLEQFRKQHNFLDPQVQSRILLESLAKVQQQRETTRAEIQELQAQYNDLEETIAFSPQNSLIASNVSQSTRYQALLNEIQKTELSLAKEQLRYTNDYPTVTKLKQQRQTQLALLRQELGNNAITTSTVAEPLANQLIQVQTIAIGLINNEQNLAESEKQIRSELKKFPSLIAEYNRLALEVEIHRKILEQQLQSQQFLGIKILQGGFDWQVLEEPDLGIYMGSRRLLLLLVGVVISPILGIAAALIWGLFNNVIFSAQDLQKLTNRPLLGSVPRLASGGTNKRTKSLSLKGWRTQVASTVEASTDLPVHETLDIIYQNIQILKYPLPFKSLMLTSALPGEGKTTLALGLGASAAHMHRRVLVIDANLRYPKLHKILNISNDWGLSLLLIDEINTHFHEYIQPIHPYIDILTAGPTPEDAVNLLSSRRMKELIELFEQTYDLVLIDAPAIFGTVDARIVASLCHGIIMVGRIGQVSPNELIQATEVLNQLNLIGVVANEVRHYPTFLAS
ncbi:GumC family protein [Cylindrospermum sp. FACHB-282]|uniref:GumC family protein n=1 Tax=Cylindrospermum sp. FACHB-282 TaxID=2692794 RepID=UPI0016822C0D|nr:Wzz/FepE/Etk N-terminal domain-containing protein [Cylindrospermum sp. FACHB-282]MBD2386619.1 polysaccharide biosynthesis tyrosine autokinase [Cylindrospermum sp. FACHB-282]